MKTLWKLTPAALVLVSGCADLRPPSVSEPAWVFGERAGLIVGEA